MVKQSSDSSNKESRDEAIKEMREQADRLSADLPSEQITGKKPPYDFTDTAAAVAYFIDMYEEETL